MAEQEWLVSVFQRVISSLIVASVGRTIRESMRPSNALLIKKYGRRKRERNSADIRIKGYKAASSSASMDFPIHIAKVFQS